MIVLLVANLKYIVVFAFTYVLPKVLLNFNTISAFDVRYIVLTMMKQ
jgi:hypothetical protein